MDLTQLHVNSLKTTCISSCISHTQGKGQIGNNQSRSPLWIIFLFSCLTYPNLFKVTIYLWLGSIGNTTEFQFAFCHKIRWNSIFWTTNCGWIIFIFSLLEEQQREWSLLQPLFGVFTQHALFQTGNRGCCVMGPNYGCEGDNSKCGMDAFYFCW